MTFGQWESVGAVTANGVVWTINADASTVPLDWVVSFDATTGFQATGGAGAAGSGPWTLKYTAELVDPNQFFSAVRTDSTTWGTADTAVVKYIKDASGTTLATASSLGGNSSGWQSFPAMNKIWVKETLAATSPDSIRGFDNTYTVVPEPTTLVAGGLLLLPFGASTLRILRKKA